MMWQLCIARFPNNCKIGFPTFVLDHAIIYNIYNNKLTKSKYKADIHCTDCQKQSNFTFMWFDIHTLHFQNCTISSYTCFSSVARFLKRWIVSHNILKNPAILQQLWPMSVKMPTCPVFLQHQGYIEVFQCHNVC